VRPYPKSRAGVRAIRIPDLLVRELEARRDLTMGEHYVESRLARLPNAQRHPATTVELASPGLEASSVQGRAVSVLPVKVNSNGYGQFDHNRASPLKVNAEWDTVWHPVCSPMRRCFRFEQFVGRRRRPRWQGEPSRRGLPWR
jgi:hypothetical protein